MFYAALATIVVAMFAIAFELCARFREARRDAKIVPWKPRNEKVLPPIARRRRIR